MLSSKLFNAYSEKLFAETFQDVLYGISIKGKIINNLRYAENTVLIADSAEGLQKIIDRVVELSRKLGVKLN